MSINDNLFDFLNNLARNMGTTGALAAVWLSNRHENLEMLWMKLLRYKR